MQRVLILGAGFGGLELATTLSESLADQVEVTLIDKSDSFVFGYAKLDVMFGRATPEAVRLPYSADREARRAHPARDDHCDRPRGSPGGHRRRDARRGRPGGRTRCRLRHGRDARPGRGRQRVLLRGRSRAAARGAADLLQRPRHRRRLRRAVQVPAGAQRVRAAAARLAVHARRPRRLPDLDRDPVRHPGAALAGHLRGAGRGVRRARHRVRAQPPGRVARPGAPGRGAGRRQRRCRTTCSWVCPSTARPTSCWPAAWPRTATSRSTRRRWRRVSRASTPSATSTTVGRAEGRRVRRGSGAGGGAGADRPRARAASPPPPYDGRGSCYIEFGGGRVGRVDVDFLSGPKPTGTFQEPSDAMARNKAPFRLQPPRALVRNLTLTATRPGGRAACPGRSQGRSWPPCRRATVIATTAIGRRSGPMIRPATPLTTAGRASGANREPRASTVRATASAPVTG